MAWVSRGCRSRDKGSPVVNLFCTNPLCPEEAVRSEACERLLCDGRLFIISTPLQTLMELCFATNNAHKIEEVSAWLGEAFTLKTLRDIGCADELPETTGTIPGNSRQKAEYVWTHFGVSCFADDSGLEVDALGGEPGVDTAHYSGSRDARQNMQKLLTNLQGAMNRKARFVTVFTLLLHGRDAVPREQQFEGTVQGVITLEPRGTEGFGYDPIFQPDGYDRTFAEMGLAEKNAISHRAIALAKMVAYLREQLPQHNVDKD